MKLYDNPFWDFNNGGKNKRKEEKNIKNSVLPKFAPLAHALRSDQFSFTSAWKVIETLGI